MWLFWAWLGCPPRSYVGAFCPQTQLAGCTYDLSWGPLSFTQAPSGSSFCNANAPPPAQGFLFTPRGEPLWMVG